MIALALAEAKRLEDLASNVTAVGERLANASRQAAQLPFEVPLEERVQQHLPLLHPTDESIQRFSREHIFSGLPEPGAISPFALFLICIFGLAMGCFACHRVACVHEEAREKDVSGLTTTKRGADATAEPA